MEVPFQYFSPLRSTPETTYRYSLPLSSRKDRLFWLPLKNRREEELAITSSWKPSFVVGPLLLAAYQELRIAARICYESYRQGKDTWFSRYFSDIFDLDNIKLEEITFPWQWPLEWRERILPCILKYQATLLTMSFFKSVLSVFVSKNVFYKLTQHPYHRARLLASQDADRLAVGVKALTMSLASNFLFYLANLTVSQVSLYYTHRKEYNWALIRRDEAAKERSVFHWAESSWELFHKQASRYFASACGAAIGSVALPGWGTMLGMGIGEEWADTSSTPKPPSFLFLLFPRLQPIFSSTDSRQESTLDVNELLCGCCQVNYFSADPNHAVCAPVSSRVCGHTICRSCVELCHLALMRRSDIFVESIKCPLCNAQEAFLPHDPIVNRALCEATSFIEKSGYILPSCEIEIEIDAATVEEFGKLTELGTSQATEVSFDTL
eukprot:scaffold22642_cov134-Cylindrotheca_fusiformis.AAC.38